LCAKFVDKNDLFRVQHKNVVSDMAIMPIEVALSGNVSAEPFGDILARANAAQSEFAFLPLDEAASQDLRQHAYRRVVADEYLKIMKAYRDSLRGFHPYLISFIDSEVDGARFSNLFGSHRAEAGLAVATISNVPDVSALELARNFKEDE